MVRSLRDVKEPLPRPPECLPASATPPRLHCGLLLCRLSRQGPNYSDRNGSCYERKAPAVAAVRSCEERRRDLGAPDHLHSILRLPETENMVCKPGHWQKSKTSKTVERNSPGPPLEKFKTSQFLANFAALGLTGDSTLAPQPAYRISRGSW